MEDFDFDHIERELNVCVPHVYRNFMTRVRELGIRFPGYEFPNTAREVVELNHELAEAHPEIWRPAFIALLPDGCGNHFALVASSLDSDEMVTIAHDPQGIEPFGSAKELFDEYLSLDNPDRMTCATE